MWKFPEWMKEYRDLLPCCIPGWPITEKEHIEEIEHLLNIDPDNCTEGEFYMSALLSPHIQLLEALHKRGKI